MFANAYICNRIYVLVYLPLIRNNAIIYVVILNILVGINRFFKFKSEIPEFNVKLNLHKFYYINWFVSISYILSECIRLWLSTSAFFCRFKQLFDSSALLFVFFLGFNLEFFKWIVSLYISSLFSWPPLLTTFSFIHIRQVTHD